MIRALVVDDHSLFRRGVAALLAENGIEVVGEAGDGDEAVRLASERDPDVVLLDLHMPGVDGVAATEKLAARTRVLILTVSEDREDLAAAIRAGAKGYVLKHVEPRALVDAVRRVVAGEDVLSPELAGAALAVARGGAAAADTPLSARERQVLDLVSRGRSNAEIGGALGISGHTVKTYVERIFEKLGVHSRAEAAAMAAKLAAAEPAAGRKGGGTG